MRVRPAYIVDDSEDQRLLIKFYFRKFMPDVDLLFFESASALFEKLKELHQESAKPFVIVLDLYMPETDGYEALLLLKQNQSLENAWWETVPVILNSSMPSEEMIEKSYKAGAQAFLTKTPDLGPLRELVETLRPGPESL